MNAQVLSHQGSVVVVTYNRPTSVRNCIESVLGQVPKPLEVIVVDASDNSETEQALAPFLNNIIFKKVNFGYGHMTRARNVGLDAASGDVVLFIDDDAVAHESWLENMLSPYADTTIGAVGGRALNLRPGEEHEGVDRVGRLDSNGQISGFFAAKTDNIIEVDHIIGCNMSFRRSLLVQLKGLREFPGTELREDTDPCLRIRRLGYKILFNPAACVDHVGAAHPHSKWKRFDARYEFYGHHNHSLLLVRNYGLFSAIVWRSYFNNLVTQTLLFIRKIVAAAGRFVLAFLGSSVGIVSGLIELITKK